jgi:hypothetical protein
MLKTKKKDAQIHLSPSVGAQLQHALHASLLASSCSGGVHTLLMCTRDDDDDAAGARRGMVVERFWLFLLEVISLH